MTMKIKYPQTIQFGDSDRVLICMRCRGFQWEYGGQNCVERFYDGGEMDGEPFEECSDLYRCVGCTNQIKLHEGSPGYRGPEYVESSD